LTQDHRTLMPLGGRRHRLRTVPDADSGATSTLSARIGEDALRSLTYSIWTPDGGGVSFDDRLGRDDLVVRLPQFHPLVIPGARR
jgi:hypothetical protein